MMERLREMFFGRRDSEPRGDSRVDEIADLKVESDATLDRVNKLTPSPVLSDRDARLRQAVRGTARGIRVSRRTGG